MKVNIRFLKQGIVHMDMPDDATTEQMRNIAQGYLNNRSNHELIFAMADCTPTEMSPSIFDDESFNVDAIERDDESYELLYANNLWKAYLKE